ncbi:MAG TPA: hypothetical protein VFD84_09605, partial [Candidatus Binatia bacterium]|nr:hypothetical protein [Candidatus Binatia bacterium]
TTPTRSNLPKAGGSERREPVSDGKRDAGKVLEAGKAEPEPKIDGRLTPLVVFQHGVGSDVPLLNRLSQVGLGKDQAARSCE